MTGHQSQSAGDNMTKKVGFAVGALVVLLLLFAGLKYAKENFTVELPQYSATANTVWLDQNWNAKQRDWFHHADQGTQTFGIPYEWFIALEQPQLSLDAPGLLSDSVYLDRYGFIPSNADSGESGLPVGFAHGGPFNNTDGDPWVNPQTHADQTSMGLTCAACHTGRLTYQNTTLLIDGGPALTNLDEFQTGVALSLLYTRYVPFRFSRFADRVLGPGASSEAKSALSKQLDQVVAQVKSIAGLEKSVKQQSIQEGYTRLDALNRIGNTVFAVDLKDPSNFVGYSAPVHYPRIWNASWFTWVQYNGSIMQPMTRNAGEALGVLAHVNLVPGKDPLYSSSVQVSALSDIEELLAGTPQPQTGTAFHGLTSPKWPDKVLPPINSELAAKGAGLYKELCQGCHMAPITDAEFWSSPQWLPPNAAGERYLDLHQIETSRIGTDPTQAADMANRRVTTPPSLGVAPTEFGPALGKVVENTVNYWYDHQQPPTAPAMREQMNGRRPNDLQTPLSYKVRPLNGIWATPPYLHNASVPTLYALLSPVEERPAKFYLGNREYDPVNVGYRIDEFPGGFVFDTTIKGNSNAGHEFSNSAGKPGVIGRQLSPDERRALIEYLKTL
jgi:hypothetical protein